MPISATGAGLKCLLDLQQSDGGWAYNTNSSWTEPTCYAILALRAASGPRQTICQATEWLTRRQRRDGGWSPGPAVEQSTHVTSLSILALSGLDGYQEVADRGVQWVLSQTGAESSVWARVARFVMGVQSVHTEHAGWPWYPGAAAWVIPTSLAIFALLKQKNGRHAVEIEGRLKEARSFLLSRRCPDHGWNHGGLFRDGEHPSSYPETTGIALLALAGMTTADLGASLHCGEQHVREPRSSEGEYWLRMGLAAHGRDPGPPSSKYRDWTVNQIALGVIVQTSRPESNPFIDYV